MITTIGFQSGIFGFLFVITMDTAFFDKKRGELLYFSSSSRMYKH